MNPIFFYDIASPNSYLAYRAIPEIENRSGITFDCRPVLLGGLFKLTGNQTPLITNAAVPAKMAYDRRDIERFIERYGLRRFKLNPHFPLNTLYAMRTIVAGATLGIGPATTDALFTAMWEAGRNLAEAAELEAALSAHGLPADELLRDAAKEEVKAGLAKATQEAAAAGVFGVPSFLVGNELYFGKERLRDVEEAAASTGAGPNDVRPVV